MPTKNPLVSPRSLDTLFIGAVCAFALVFFTSCQTTTTTENSSVSMPTEGMSGSILDSRLSSLEKEVREYPKKHALHYEIAEVHYQKNELKECAKALHKAIDLSPTVVKYHYHLGRVYLRMSELELAEAEFRAACDHMARGRYTGPHAALGYTLARQGRLDEAIAEFETCLTIEPGNPSFYYFLGSLYDMKVDGENVIRYYREYLARGGKKYRKKVLFVLGKLGVEVETDSSALISAGESPGTSFDESLFGSPTPAESSDSSD